MLRVLSTIFPALLNVNPDGIYGESTKNAVSAFQRFAHLPATGIAETETWNALAGYYLRHAPSVLPPEPLRIVLQPGQTIAPGERNLHVYLVQAMLQALGQCYANASPPAVTGVLARFTSAPCGACRRCSVTSRPASLITASGNPPRLYTLSTGDGTQSASSGAAPAAKYLL